MQALRSSKEQEVSELKMQIIESKYQKQALNQKNSAGLIDNLKSHVIIETPDDLQNELKSQILQYELQIQILNQNMFN